VRIKIYLHHFQARNTLETKLKIRVRDQPEVGSQFAFRDARMQYVTDVKSCALGVEPLFTLGKDLACLLRANIVCDVNYDSRSHGNMLGLNY
jgi:hypothetical protein